MAFTEEQAARLSKVTLSQVRYWDRSDFFKPTYASENRRLKYSRIYSFKDVVGLRMLSLLINEHGVPTRYLRRVRETLQRPQEVWADTTLYVLGKRVYLERPEIDSYEEPTSGQLTLKNIPLRRVIGEVRKAADKLRERPVESFGEVGERRHISSKSQIVEGTRVPVSAVLEYLEDGADTSEILRNFPTLVSEDVEAIRQMHDLGAA